MMHNAPDLKSRNKGNRSRNRVDAACVRSAQKLASANLVVTIKGYYENIMSDCFTTLDGLYCKADYTRDLDRINTRLDSEGINFVTKTLPDYINCVLSLIDNKDASFSHLKLRRDSRIPVFLGGMTSLVLESTDQTISAIALNCLYTVCVAFKKLRGEYSEKVLLRQFEAFVQVDKDLPTEFNGHTAKILALACELCGEFIKDIDLSHESFRPKPGPGATNTPTRKVERYSPRTLYTQIDDVMPYADWFYYNPYAVVHRSREYTALMNAKVQRPTARFKYVPKTYGKARGICIEENETQVLQQAIRNGLWYYIQNSSISKNLPLTDQTVNALLALTSSLDLIFDTIDMSEASDRVARLIVWHMFQANPELLDVLMALSTRVIIPPKVDGVQQEPIECNKFAPMGSGLCFPIMSLVHLFLVQAIILTTDLPNKRTLIKDVRVYGDDIVLPSCTTLAVMTELPAFGMKLNTDKSFTSGHFRESCGIHAYYGMDVTPVYVKYTPQKDDLTVLQSLLENESDFYKKGFYQTAAFLRKSLSVAYPRLKLLEHAGSKDNGFVGYYRCLTPRIVDAFKNRCKVKWNTELQCNMFRVPRFSTRVSTAELTQDEAFLRWLWMGAENSQIVDDGVELTSIAWLWVPESHIGAAPALSGKLSHSRAYCAYGFNW